MPQTNPPVERTMIKKTIATKNQKGLGVF